MKIRNWILIAFLAVVAGVLLFPRKEILVPKMVVTVRYENGDLVTDGEVSRNWNSYLGDGWTASIARTDENGKARFPETNKRVPLLVSGFWSLAAPFLHYYPGFAGSIVARDHDEHHIWARTDFNDRDCCPSEIKIGSHQSEGEASDSYFTFGNVVPNQ